MDKIEIISPKPYARVGAEFLLSGWIPKSWLKTDWGSMDYRVLGEFLDIDAVDFSSTVSVAVQHGLFSIFRKKLYFSTLVRFSAFNKPFIAKSQGHIALKLNGIKKGCVFFLPLIVNGFEPKTGVDSRIEEKHKNIGKKFLQYEIDLENYNKELAEIVASRKAKDDNKELHYLQGQNVGIATEILKILNDAEGNFKQYAYSEEDRRERELEEKYKDAIAWRGPLLRGIISQFGGFELRVYSDDHDKHFHVIHREKGVNARFSFPEIQLINYKNSNNSISSKQEKRIREYCLQPEIFTKFDQEFKKRSA